MNPLVANIWALHAKAAADVREDRKLLAKVADELKAHGHAVSHGLTDIYIGEQFVAWTTAGKLFVLAANVFDGVKHATPKGCATATYTPGSRYAIVDRIVAAIEKRIAARAKSLPVPVDQTAIVRD